MKGKLIKKQSSVFFVDSGKKIFKCASRGKVKITGLLVGDNVEFNEKTESIEKILPRKNKLLRPPLANIDALIILITSEPTPDYLLLDKLILFCKVNGITPILCHSKMDLNTSNAEYLTKTYGEFFEIIEISAHKNLGLEKLKNLMQNKISAFAGQSGVGKSALINALFDKNLALEGTLSDKIARGKNTTRHTELYKISDNTYIADTAGFSSLDEKYLPIKQSELPYYYPDFLKFLPNCRFKSCCHNLEAECGVKKAVEAGLLDKARYERYLIIFENLKSEYC